MLAMGIEEIRKLSQDEGMYDTEIALILGIHRVTVTRARIRENIPRVSLVNRKDKRVICTKCKNSFIIRRKERVWRCPHCVSL